MNRTKWLRRLLLLLAALSLGCGGSGPEPTAVMASIDPNPLFGFQFPCRTIGGVPLPCSSTIYVEFNLVLTETSGRSWTLESMRSHVIEDRTGRVIESRTWSQAEIRSQNSGDTELAAAGTLSAFFMIDVPEGRHVPLRLELQPLMRSQGGDKWNGSVAARIVIPPDLRP